MYAIRSYYEWFRSQCDGEWEHDNRIKIETLDNPGWDVWINFDYSQLSLDVITSYSIHYTKLYEEATLH